MLALIVVAGAAIADASPRKGQVVRIERRRAAAVTAVHLCVQEQRKEHMLCLGKAPPPGERISLVGFNTMNGGAGDVAVARVLRSEPADEDKCRTGMMHRVAFELEGRGGGPDTQISLGLRGFDLPQGTRLSLSPNTTIPAHLGNYSVQLGFDTDGDTRADILLARRECAPGPGAMGSECYAYLRDKDGDWSILGEDRFDSCN
jgi:hypothetical protein